MIGVGRRGCPALVRFEARYELVEAEFLKALADGLELGRAELDETPSFAAQLQRLPEAGLPGIQAGDDRLQAGAGGFVGQRFFDGHRPAEATATPGRTRSY